MTQMNDVITPGEFLEQMQEIANDPHYDNEIAHVRADGLMMRTLESLGYADGVEVFFKMPVWYA